MHILKKKYFLYVAKHRKLFFAVNIIRIFVIFFKQYNVYRDTVVQFDYPLESQNVIDYDHPKLKDTATVLIANQLKMINYKGVWDSLNLDTVKCFPVPKLSRSELKFHHFCPDRGRSVQSSMGVAYIMNNERHAIRLAYEYAKRQEATVLLDIGANVGAWCIPFANALSNVKVIAVEPVIENVRRLTKAIILNGLQDRTVILNHAIFDKAYQQVQMASSDKDLTLARILADGVVVPEHSSRLTDAVENSVSTITFDQLIPLVKSYKQCIVKLDVEGAECIAVKKIDKFLSDIPVPMIVMETDKIARADEDCVEMAFSLLSKRGFTPYTVLMDKLDWSEYKQWDHVNTIWINSAYTIPHW